LIFFELYSGVPIDWKKQLKPSTSSSSSRNRIQKFSDEFKLNCPDGVDYSDVLPPSKRIPLMQTITGISYTNMNIYISVCMCICLYANTCISQSVLLINWFLQLDLFMHYVFIFIFCSIHAMPYWLGLYVNVKHIRRELILWTTVLL
jgi:hypothetical protein